MRKFEVGDKVLCKTVYIHKGGYPYGIEVGKIYTVEKVMVCKCGRGLITLRDANTNSKKECECGALNESNAYYADRFNIVKEKHIKKLKKWGFYF